MYVKPCQRLYSINQSDSLTPRLQDYLQDEKTAKPKTKIHLVFPQARTSSRSVGKTVRTS